MRYLQFTISALVAFGFTVVTQLPAQALDPAPKCESGKLKEAGKYASCHLKADSKAVKKGTPADYSKCTSKFSDKWDKLESKGAGACPSNGDQASMQARVTLDEAEVAILLAGGTVPECGNGVVEGNESCDASDLAGQDCVGLGYANGTLGCTAGCGYDLSGCTPYPPPSLCGNGVFDPGEECELGTLNGQGCISQGYPGGGTLSCSPGCVFDTSGCVAVKLVFVTTGTWTGNLGGLAGADAKCQAEAQAAGLSGTFKAWLSTAGGNSPATRFVHSAAPYTLVGGTTVADGWLDLVDGHLNSPIGEDAAGVGRAFTFVWTNTNWTGDALGADDCNGWMGTWGWSNGVGQTNAVTQYWTVNGNTYFCGSAHALYCFEQ